MGQINVTFSNLAHVLSGSFCLGQGISPSTGSIAFAPQEDAIETEGNLTFTDGLRSVTIKGCRIENVRAQSGASGRIWTATVKDKRWRWAFGHITGAFNQRDAWGAVKAETEKKPSELAVLCLDALDETNVDVSALPDNARPEIYWDHQNPAQALQQLCDLFGCRISLAMDGRVSIVAVGSGVELPDYPYSSMDEVVDPPDRPEWITLIGGRNEYQVECLLEAVGLDVDGAVKLLNWTGAPGGDDYTSWLADYSYGGKFPALTSPAKEAAERTAYRWYRIRDGITVRPFASSFARRKLLPLLDRLVDVEDYTEDGYIFQRPRRPFVKGAHARADGLGGWENAEIGTLLPAPFGLDAARGIVEFSEPVFYWNESGDAKNGMQPCTTLQLTCSVHAPFDVGTYRYSMSVAGGHADLVDVVRRPELFLKYKDGAPVNKPETQAEALEYCRGRLAVYGGETYASDRGKSAQYCGIFPIELDGAIREVAWDVGPGGATTHAAWNAELFRARPSYRARRQIEKVKAVAFSAQHGADRFMRELNRETEDRSWGND